MQNEWIKDEFKQPDWQEEKVRVETKSNWINTKKVRCSDKQRAIMVVRSVLQMKVREEDPEFRSIMEYY